MNYIVPSSAANNPVRAAFLLNHAKVRARINRTGEFREISTVEQADEHVLAWYQRPESDRRERIMVARRKFDRARQRVHEARRELNDALKQADMACAEVEQLSTVRVEDLQKLVAGYFGISRFQLLAHRRKTEIVMARQIAMYLAHKMTAKSYPALGRLFDRDHTTIIYAIQQMDKKKNVEPYASKLYDIEALMKSQWGIEANAG